MSILRGSIRLLYKLVFTILHINIKLYNSISWFKYCIRIFMLKFPAIRNFLLELYNRLNYLSANQAIQIIYTQLEQEYAEKNKSINQHEHKGISHSADYIVDNMEIFFKQINTSENAAQALSGFSYLLAEYTKTIVKKHTAHGLSEESIKRYSLPLLTKLDIREKVISYIIQQADLDFAAEDLKDIATAIFSREQLATSKRIFVDISDMRTKEFATGIQRVTKNILFNFLESGMDGYVLEPVYERSGKYYYAREYMLAWCGYTTDLITDDIIAPQNGDIFFGLDFCCVHVINMQLLLRKWQEQGVKIMFVVYDLLPITKSNFFPITSSQYFTKWLEIITGVADNLIGISQATANDLRQWLTHNNINTAAQIAAFHLGADIKVSTAKRALSVADSGIINKIKATTSLLIVGTLEPRKAHAQVLASLEQLWQEGIEVTLVIVGKQGWHVDKLVKRIQQHQQNAQQLLWLDSIDDGMLEVIYKSANLLLAPALAEGFGLPLIEAAQYKLPILARDIPVFREVAGEHASYFTGEEPEDLAAAIKQWLKDDAAGIAVQSTNMPWLTWQQSAQSLQQLIMDNDIS
jgi:glycosyltransferase involved in cell wall biosynthesis